MSENEVINNTESKGKFGKTQIIQSVLILVALIICILGFVRYTDIRRLIIYGGQALFCVLIFVFGVLKFKDGDQKIIRMVIGVYGFLQALRVVLLNIVGVKPGAGEIARYVLVLIACTCFLLADRMGKESFKKTAYVLFGLEVLLYVVFLIGFPGVLLGQLNKFMPLVGILIAGSMAFIQEKAE